jgi:hypothetical protein
MARSAGGTFQAQRVPPETKAQLADHFRVRGVCLPRDTDHSLFNAVAIDGNATGNVYAAGFVSGPGRSLFGPEVVVTPTASSSVVRTPNSQPPREPPWKTSSLSATQLMAMQCVLNRLSPESPSAIPQAQRTGLGISSGSGTSCGPAPTNSTKEYSRRVQLLAKTSSAAT